MHIIQGHVLHVARECEKPKWDGTAHFLELCVYMLTR